MTDVQAPPAPPAATTRRWAALSGVAALTLLGAALRLIPIHESGLWRDEVSSMLIAGMPTAREIVVHSRLHEPHPPLYYLVLHYWLGVFGHTTEAGLALSLLFGVALIPLTWLAGRRIFSPAVGLVAALLVACSPELIRYSGFLRPYSILPVLVVGSTWALWAALTRGGTGRWAAYACWSAIMVAMNYWPVLIVASQALVAAGWLLWADPTRRHHLRRVVAAVLVLGAMGVPVAARLLDPSRISGHPPKPVPPWDPFIALARVSTGLPFVLALPVFGALLIGAVLWLRRHATERRSEVLALGLTLGVAVVSMVPAWVLSHKVNMLQVRFLLMPTPLVALAAGWGFARLLGSRRVLAIVLLEALVAGNLLEWHFDRFVHSNGRELAAAVGAQARPSDLIVFAPSWVGASFWYYYRGKNTMIEFPILHGQAGSVGGVAAAMASPTSVDEVMALVAPAKAGGRRVWLIMERRAITDSVKYVDPREPQTDASYSRTAIGRSNELRRALAGAYGPPDTTTIPPDPRPVGELLQALLFGR